MYELKYKLTYKRLICECKGGFRSIHLHLILTYRKD